MISYTKFINLIKKSGDLVYYKVLDNDVCERFGLNNTFKLILNEGEFMNVVDIKKVPKCYYCGNDVIAEFVEYRQYGDTVLMCNDCFSKIYVYISKSEIGDLCDNFCND